MFAWWKKSVACAGSVLFRGALPQQPGEFAFLQAQGIATAPLPETPSAYWGMALRHAQWGEATLVCLRDMPPLPPELIACQPLSDAERASARRGESTLTIRLEGTHGHVLRDRKHLLRFLRAVMADDGVAAVDHLSQLIWSREMLEDELSHDGDLDVEGLYCLHAILPDAAPAAEDAERQPCWIHSHGLQEIGEFDFDIVDPQAEVNSDLFRAIAFAIVERRMTLEMRRYRLAQPHGDVRPVAMARFLAQAEPRYRQLLADQVDAEHRTEHAVLCEPEGGLLSRWFARGLKPAKLLQRPPEHPLIFFSSEATDLMAQRARDSYGVFRRLREEFGFVGTPVRVEVKAREKRGKK